MGSKKSLVDHLIFTGLLAFGLAAGAVAAPISGQGTWEKTLHARDLDGNAGNGPEAYYDSALNITWLADAFQARTSLYQARPYYGPGDSLIWPHALEWASNLVLYGIRDWRLPKSFDTGSAGCLSHVAGGECGYNVNPASSEMAHMFHTTLGNVSYIAPNGTVASNSGATNTANFLNLYSGNYWSETEADTVLAWNFNFRDGNQSLSVKTVQGSAAWAVLDGDRGTPMGVVPEPSGLALVPFGAAVVALVRRRARSSQAS
jgi:hypothetical protein